MSTMTQRERQALEELFGVMGKKESRFSKIKRSLETFFYFLKYFLKDKAHPKFSS